MLGLSIIDCTLFKIKKTSQPTHIPHNNVKINQSLHFQLFDLGFLQQLSKVFFDNVEQNFSNSEFQVNKAGYENIDVPIDYHDCVDVPELVDSFIIFSFFKKTLKLTSLVQIYIVMMVQGYSRVFPIQKLKTKKPIKTKSFQRVWFVSRNAMEFTTDFQM